MTDYGSLSTLCVTRTRLPTPQDDAPAEGTNNLDSKIMLSVGKGRHTVIFTTLKRRYFTRPTLIVKIFLHT